MLELHGRICPPLARPFPNPHIVRLSMQGSVRRKNNRPHRLRKPMGTVGLMGCFHGRGREAGVDLAYDELLCGGRASGLVHDGNIGAGGKSGEVDAAVGIYVGHLHGLSGGVHHADIRSDGGTVHIEFARLAVVVQCHGAVVTDDLMDAVGILLVTVVEGVGEGEFTGIDVAGPYILGEALVLAELDVRDAVLGSIGIVDAVGGNRGVVGEGDAGVDETGGGEEVEGDDVAVLKGIALGVGEGKALFGICGVGHIVACALGKGAVGVVVVKDLSHHVVDVPYGPVLLVFYFLGELSAAVIGLQHIVEGGIELIGPIGVLAHHLSIVVVGVDDACAGNHLAVVGIGVLAHDDATFLVVLVVDAVDGDHLVRVVRIGKVLLGADAYELSQFVVGVGIDEIERCQIVDVRTGFHQSTAVVGELLNFGFVFRSKLGEADVVGLLGLNGKGGCQHGSKNVEMFHAFSV